MLKRMGLFSGIADQYTNARASTSVVFRVRVLFTKTCSFSNRTAIGQLNKAWEQFPKIPFSEV